VGGLTVGRSTSGVSVRLTGVTSARQAGHIAPSRLKESRCCGLSERVAFVGGMPSADFWGRYATDMVSDHIE